MWRGFIMGCGMVIASVLGVVANPNSYHSKYKAAIDACEKVIPRDQHCKVIAVPIQKGNTT